MSAFLGSIRDLPIRQKMLVAIIGTSMLVLVINASVSLLLGWNSTKTRIERELKITSQIYAENVSAALSFNDDVAARTLLASLKSLPELELACVFRGSVSRQPVVFAEYNPLLSKTPCKSVGALGDSGTDSTHIEAISPVTIDSEPLGYIYLRRSVDDLVASSKVAGATVVLTLVICVAVAYGLASFFRGLIEQPIQRLLRVTQKLSQEPDLATRVEKFANDEIGKLFDSFNHMIAQIQDRDSQLQATRKELEVRLGEIEATNSTLNQTLLRLKKTQEQLVHQEKMASLGALVAGVAHEINTPIGVGVTASSTLHSSTEEALENYEAGRLTDSGLRRYMSMAIQSANILMTNLNRAANLIHSFKQVAVDQSSSETRRFNLYEYVEEILLSLRPRLKKTLIKVNVNIDKSIQVHSYPGAISQVITNLVMNSLVHGFPDNQPGSISLGAECDEGGLITLIYADDGEGISEQNLRKVFDPFFTTRRAAGGSGLGMHIVYNLVTQQLGGKIDIHSEQGRGVLVQLTFPVDIRQAGVPS